MRLLRGAGAGHEVIPAQWANDWITHDRVEFRSGIASPLNVQLVGEEFGRFRESMGTLHVGKFWEQWCLLADGTFHERSPLAPASADGYPTDNRAVVLREIADLQVYGLASVRSEGQQRALLWLMRNEYATYTPRGPIVLTEIGIKLGKIWENRGRA